MRDLRLHHSPSTRFLSLSFNLKVTLVLVFVVAALVGQLPISAGAKKATTAPQMRSKTRLAEFVPGELLVRFRAGSALADLKSGRSTLLSLVAGRTVRVELARFGGSDLVPGLMLARVAAEDTPFALKTLRERHDVLYAEPNYIRHADLVPNDTRYADLFALKNSSVDGGGISAEAAWDTTTGSHSVVVGVVDSGIDISHLDLKDNIFINSGEIPNNGIDDDNNGFIDDVNGWDFVSHDRTVFDNANDDAHGTHVAGIIGARGNNAVGVVGVNWDVQLMPLKALGPQGATDAGLLEAFSYARMMRQRGVNLRVLNNSYGGQGFSQSLLDAIKELGNAGILFVAAAGNESLNNDFVPQFPASYDLPNIISVAASTQFGLISSFSNRGAQSVHLAAPGENILSTTPHGYAGEGLVAADTEPDGSTYSLLSGTSMASPHVAGVAALACAANPNMSLQQLRATVLFSGDQSSNFSNIVITGSRLNAKKALQAALENDLTPPATPANFRINSQNGRRIELRWSESGDDGIAGRAALDEITFADSLTGEQFRLNSSRALDPGTDRVVFVSIPFKHPTGAVTLRTLDNVGNSSTASASVTVAADVSDPYTITLDPPGALTALNSGTPVGLKGDDTTFDFVTIPFQFPFFGAGVTSVAVSTNGALYIPIPPDFALPHPNVGGDDGAAATTTNLAHLAMIAGMWSDLRTDRHPTDDVYIVKPDRDRIIFRWQAVEFGIETPVNFEIELRRDGTIQTRYGNGNINLQPVVVGISGGDPDTYLVPTHTSETAPLSLTNAQGVTFALRNPPPPLSADLKVTLAASPDPVVSGHNLTYNVLVNNLGPSPTEDLVMTDVLPAGTTFVSCTSEHIFATCTGPAVGSNGTVTGKIATLDTPPGDAGIGFRIVVKVTAAPGASVQNNASATSFRSDPVPANNTASVSSNVVAETFFSAAKAIAAGRSHTTSVRNDGTVWTWGTGSDGQLGDGNNGIGVGAGTPAQVTALEGFSSVADGNGFVLALKADGEVWAWGFNNSGQLGDGTTTERTRPVLTNSLGGVTAISAGNFSAALRSDGTVWVWGTNAGIGSAIAAIRSNPVQLTGIANVSAIAAGGGHLLMLKADKTVWAAGSNSFGQLGDGTTVDRPFPVQVSGLANVSRIAAGQDEFSVAVKEDGTIWAWGINFNGQLGPGAGPINFNPHPTPLQVTGLPSTISNIATGKDFCLALAGDGTVWSWGNNTDFQLGQGTSVGQNPMPARIPNLGGVAALAGGVNHSVALKTDGSVWTWGGNSEGQLGDGSTTMHLQPAPVSGLPTVSAPSISPPGGVFATSVDITITCATPGATIHFTTDGQDPTENDPTIASGASVHWTGFRFLRARAWQSGLFPSSTSFAQFDFGTPSNPLQLLLDQSGPASDQLAALNSVLFLRDPFPVLDLFSFGMDPNTRVMFLVKNLQLAQAETASSVVVSLTDANSHTYDIPAEDVRSVPNLDLTQVIFRLPDNLPAGPCQVKLKAHSQTSNVGSFRIRL